MKKLGIKVHGYELYANDATQNAKVGVKGKARPIAEVYGAMSKGEARRLRKRLHANGHGGLASVRRSAA